mmetsp:Transcript_15061/g.46787  ORF Transcript_15061/g.46787 Transcript_15061/m.46787 type:complete len:216 (-) Transcript_15061:164-811(-)
MLRWKKRAKDDEPSKHRAETVALYALMRCLGKNRSSSSHRSAESRVNVYSPCGTAQGSRASGSDDADGFGVADVVFASSRRPASRNPASSSGNLRRVATSSGTAAKSCSSAGSDSAKRIFTTASRGRRQPLVALGPGRRSASASLGARHRSVPSDAWSAADTSSSAAPAIKRHSAPARHASRGRTRPRGASATSGSRAAACTRKSTRSKSIRAGR